VIDNFDDGFRCCSCSAPLELISDNIRDKVALFNTQFEFVFESLAEMEKFGLLKDEGV
jgi:hypothetical protein